MTLLCQALITLVLGTFHPPTVVFQGADTGMGHCTMDQHFHNEDGLCHRDSDDSPLNVLEVPNPDNVQI